ncbi:MAG: GDYXXLXY domain-containing protein [Planctomycetota bacterium]|jgi:uncharacterized membrane-anchored protein
MMDRRKKVAGIWIGMQLLFFLLWAQMEEGRFAHGEGQSILVRTVPVDPRDLLRGQFIQLAYEFSRSGFQSALSAGESGETAWVVLAPDAQFYSPRSLHLTRPTDLMPGEVFLRGTFDRFGSIRYGIERFFVAEGTETPDQSEITVRLRVAADGSPRIEQVYVRGLPWPR